MKVKVTYQRSNSEYYLRAANANVIEVNGSLYELQSLVAVFPNLPVLPYGIIWVDSDETYGFIVTAAVPYNAESAPEDYEVITDGPEVIFDNRS